MHNVISKATNMQITLNYKKCIKSYCKSKEKKHLSTHLGRKGIKDRKSTQKKLRKIYNILVEIQISFEWIGLGNEPKNNPL